MTDCLLAVDLFGDFAHDDGDRLLRSLRARRPGLVGAVRHARTVGIPVVYANDTRGVWDGDAAALVRRALEGPGGDVLREVAPEPGDPFLVKPRYSAFDLTPLALVLEALDVDRLLLVGTATEMCVTQTAIDARERGYHVTVVTGACATVDERNEQTALEYLQAITGTYLADDLPEAMGQW